LATSRAYSLGDMFFHVSAVVRPASVLILARTASGKAVIKVIAGYFL
jgi:hypothetical protein